MPRRMMILMMIGISTALQAESSHSGAELASYSTCEIILLRQQQPSKLNLVDLGMSTHGVSGSSYWFSAPKGITVKEFVAVRDGKIRRTLRKQLLVNGIGGDMRLMIDIEKPVHPKNFTSYRRKYGERAFERLIAAFKRRVDIARELLPKARIGIYGMPTPTGSRRKAFTLATQISGIQAAADLGLLDSVDEIYPTLYLRYGPGDRNYRMKIKEMTRDGIEHALTIRRADGSAPGVIPLFSYKIFNGGSANHKEVAPIELGRLQWRIAQSIDGISAIAYWTAKDSSELKQWLEKLKPLPDSCAPKEKK